MGIGRAGAIPLGRLAGSGRNPRNDMTPVSAWSEGQPKLHHTPISLLIKSARESGINPNHRVLAGPRRFPTPWLSGHDPAHPDPWHTWNFPL